MISEDLLSVQVWFDLVNHQETINQVFDLKKNTKKYSSNKLINSNIV